MSPSSSTVPTTCAAGSSLRLSLGEEARRGPWSELAADQGTRQALDTLRTRLGDLHAALEALRGRGKGLDSCLARGTEFGRRLTRLAEGDDSEDIRWYETQGKGFRLHQTHLQVADIFQSQRERYRATWIFTSATLAVGKRFDHFARQLGIDDARTERWESPFDYGRHALWFVPRGMPDPTTGTYGTAVMALATQLLEYSRGRAFLLFTSHRTLREAASELEARIPYPLLVQGSAPRAELLERFRRLGNAVLLGTASFWEGVDVRGEALSCVVIDKLPFASPGDPVSPPASTPCDAKHEPHPSHVCLLPLIKRSMRFSRTALSCASTSEAIARGVQP